MPAKQLRCEASVIPDNDPTGEQAIERGAIALACADCGDSAGCLEHAVICPKCGSPVCDFCAEDHTWHTDAADIAA
jgi:Zn finger protein HypA/HybF involved in hydrogenase expression